MRWLKRMAPLLLAAACAGQSTMRGAATYAGASNYARTATEAMAPALPQAWVNSQECDAPNGVYDAIKTVKATGGDYAGTQAGLNQAMADWAVAADQWELVQVDAGLLLAGSTTVSIPYKAGATKCLRVQSSVPPTAGQTLCSHRITDNPDESNPRNPGCTNDVANLFTIEQTAYNNNAVACASGANHVVFSDAELRPPVADAHSIWNQLLQCGDNTTTDVSQLPYDVGFEYLYIHTWGPGDVGAPAHGTAMGTAIEADCVRCWFMWNYAEKIQADSSESHVFHTQNTPGPMKVVGNFFEGASITWFTGGGGCENPSLASSPTGLTEVGTTVTVTLASLPYHLAYLGETVFIYGAGVADYNGTWVVTNVLSTTKFQYTSTIAGSAASGGGKMYDVNCSPTGIPQVAPSDIELRENRLTRDITWKNVSGSQCTTPTSPLYPCTQHWAIKNSLEFKGGRRVLVDGNIIENSWVDGQTGYCILLDTRNCSGGTTCDIPGAGQAPSNNTTDFTFTNNIVRNCAAGIQLDGRSGPSSNGGGVSAGGRRWLFSNLLMYNIDDSAYQYYPGASHHYVSLGSSQNSFICSAVRDGHGLTSTLTCPSGGHGFNETGISPGDIVQVGDRSGSPPSNCADPSFNTPYSTTNNQGAIAIVALPPTWPGGLTVTYSNPGTAGATTTGCYLSNNSGWPKGVTFRHSTFASATGVDQGTGNARVQLQYGATSLVQNFTLMDSLFANGIALNSVGQGGEGTKAADCCLDESTLTFHHNVAGTRTANNYTEFGGANNGAHNPVTIYFPANTGCATGNATSEGSCIGLAGFMNGTGYSGAPADYHRFALDASSPYKGRASDGGDIGANLSEIDAALITRKYKCTTGCGSGPYADEPAVPATLFGMHINSSSSLWPTVPVGSLRLMDDATAWPFLNGSTQGTYTWSNLDNWLSLAKAHGVTDLMYLMGRTPNWSSSNPTDTSCQYYNANPGSGAFAPGQCYPTSDLAAGSSDAMWTGWAAALASHINGLGGSYSKPSVFEPWNEVTVATGWKGTDAQLAQLTIDASATIKPILGGARISSPTTVNWNPPAAKGVATALTNIFNATPTLSASNGVRTVANSVDMLSFHSYMNSGDPEELMNMAAMLRASVSAASRYALWDTELSWGANSPLVNDEDLRAAYIARSYLVGYTAAGFQRMYWYGWDFSNTGNTGLASWTDTARCTQAIGSAGGHAWYLCRSGIAYQQVNSWMVGNTVTQACSGPMPVLGGTSAYGLWTCGLQKPDGTMLRVVWNTSNCMGGTLASCATTTYTAPPGTTGYYTLDDGNFTAAAPGQVLTVGAKPIAIAWR